jgi:hypothetical protein
MLGDPVPHLTAIRAIPPEQAQLFAGSSEVREEELGSCGGGDRSGSDHHGHEPSQSIDPDRPLAAFHLFPFSLPRSPPRSVVLTLCLARQPAVGA